MSRPWLAPRGPKLDREVLLHTIRDLCIDDCGGFFRLFLFEVFSGLHAVSRMRDVRLSQWRRYQQVPCILPSVYPVLGRSRRRGRGRPGVSFNHLLINARSVSENAKDSNFSLTVFSLAVIARCF